MIKTIKTSLLLIVLVVIQAGSVFSAEISGIVTICDKSSTIPVEAARVIAGKEIFFHSVKGAPDTIINPQNIAGEAVTEKNGAFSLNIPPGNYSLLIWKQYFIPTHMKITVTGNGKFNAMLNHDRLDGWEKRHVRLEYRKPSSKP